MSVVENSLYFRLGIEQSPSQCSSLSVDDVRKVIVGITTFRSLFVFSQSRVKVSASLTNVGGLMTSFTRVFQPIPLWLN